MLSPKEIIASRARWLADAETRLAETLEEIALFEQGNFAWERKFKLPFPGSGYAATMRAQRDRLTLEIERHKHADAEKVNARPIPGNVAR